MRPSATPIRGVRWLLRAPGRCADVSVFRAAILPPDFVCARRSWAFFIHTF